MSVTINGTTGIAGVDGSASTPAVQGTDTNTGIFFPAADTIAFGEGGAEAMRIDSSGNVGIGTSSPSGRLQIKDSAIFRAATDYVSNTYEAIYTETNTGGSGVYPFNANGHLVIQPRTSTGNARDIVFATGSNTPSTRAVITSGGDLLVGTTTAQGRLTITGSTSDSTAYTFTTEAADGTDQLRVRCDGAVYMGLDGSSPYNLTNGAAANAVLLSDGFLYRSTSSLRYKKEIQDATHGLAEVLTLRPVTYKGTSSSDGENIYGGFIAEEVHAVGLTEFVQYDNDGQPDALHYGNMVSLMAKAIQEQQALITALTARIAALEAK
jgi:hypothetical protein